MNIPETFFSVHEQLVLFGLSCVLGVAIGICYDVFRMFRIIFPHNSWLVCIEDVLFLCGYAVALSAFVSVAARGEFRIYYVVGNIIGFAIYFFTAGSAVVSAMRKIYGMTIKIITFIMYPFYRVYVFLREKVRAKFVGNSKVFSKFIKNAKLLLLKYICLMYNKKENKNRKNVSIVAKKSKKNKTAKRSF